MTDYGLLYSHAHAAEIDGPYTYNKAILRAVEVHNAQPGIGIAWVKRENDTDPWHDARGRTPEQIAKERWG